MKKIFSQTVERYFYENEEERLEHIEDMKKKIVIYNYIKKLF